MPLLLLFLLCSLHLLLRYGASRGSVAACAADAARNLLTRASRRLALGRPSSSSSSSSSLSKGFPSTVAAASATTAGGSSAAGVAPGEAICAVASVLESAACWGLAPSARAAVASGLARAVSELPPADAERCLAAVAAPALARLVAVGKSSGGGGMGGGVVSGVGGGGEMSSGEAEAEAAAEVTVLSALVRGSRAAVGPTDLESFKASNGCISGGSGGGGGEGACVASDREWLLEAEASPALALLAAAWQPLAAALAAASAPLRASSSFGHACGPASSSLQGLSPSLGRCGKELAEGVVDLARSAALLPLRRRPDTLAAACHLTGALLPSAPIAVRAGLVPDTFKYRVRF